MRYDFQHVALDIPLVLVDQSTYAFEDEESDRAVDVSWDLIEEDLDPADVIEPLAKQVSDAYGDNAEVLSSDPITVLGEPARRIVQRVALEGGELTFWMVGTGKKPAALILKYSATARTEVEEREFAHVLSSIAPADHPWVRKGAPGFVRRQAGRITLEVPRGLSFPTEYRFATRDSTLRLMLSYAARLEARPPDFSKLIYVPDKRVEQLRVADEQAEPATLEAGSGTDTRWEIERVRGEEVSERAAVRRLALQIRSDLAFHLTGVGSGAGIRALDAAWPQLKGTLAKGK
jgi:hypothetical protein